MKSERHCPICKSTMHFAFQNTLLLKYTVDYFSCNDCGLLQTENPYWLEEAYNEVVSKFDTGIVSRNINNKQVLIPLLSYLFKGKGQYIDLGGGTGLLTRLLRDVGLDCYLSDKYNNNVFAKPFQLNIGIKANALFAFEVLEHIEDPLDFINSNFQNYNCNTLILSTVTFNGKVPEKNWWYYGFEHGQHITFYQPKTISRLAKELKCKYYRIGENHYLISALALSSFTLFLFTNKLFFWLLSRYYGIRSQTSLIERDFSSIKLF